MGKDARFWLLLLTITFFASSDNINSNNTAKNDLKTLSEFKIDAIISSDNIYDSTQIKRLFEQSKVLRVAHPDSSKMIVRDALIKSLTINYLNGIINAVGYIAQLYSIEGKFDSSRKYYDLGLYYAQQYPPEKCISEFFLSCIAKDFYYQAKYDSAFFYLYQAADKMRTHGIEEFGKAYTVYQNIGVIWANTGNLKKAQVYFDKAEGIAILSNDSTLINDLFVTKASYYSKNNIWDTALKYYHLVLNSSNSDTSTLIAANMNLGSLYMHLNNENDPLKSIPYFQAALRLSGEYFGKSKRSFQQAYFKLGLVYINAASQLQDHGYLRKGLHILERISQDTASLGFLENDLLVLHTNLSEIYANEGKYEKAYEQSLVALNLRDSLYQKEKLDLMGNLDVQFRTAEKDKQLAQNRLYISQQKNKIQQKNFWIGGIAASAVLLSALLLSASRSSRRKKRIHENQLQLLQQQQEINQLKAAMKGEEKERARLARELHDGVGGMLASIKMNVSVAKSQNNPVLKAADLEEVLLLVEQTADEVRRTSHNLMPEVLRKYNLPQALRMYCESLNNGKSPQIDLQFHSGWPEQRLELELPLYRILQELIQNIIKHAQASAVVIQFRFQDEKLHVTVEDDGIGFETDKISSGLGLSNIRSRVRALRGDIFIESHPGRGTTCYIELPAGYQKNTAHE